MGDLRYAFRMLRAHPGVTTVAVLSLALGIGANTAVFSILDAVLLRTLPVREPQQLLEITVDKDSSFTNPIWEQLRDHLPRQVFSGAFAWSGTRFNLATGGESQPIAGALVSGDYFATLGVPAVAGRTITRADDSRNAGAANAVAVISYSFWQRHFGGDRAAIGQTIHLDGQPFQIIGVAPPSFFGMDVGRTADITIPIAAEPLIRKENSALDQRSYWWLSVAGRLQPGVPPQQATAALKTMAPGVFETTVPPDIRREYVKDYLRYSFETRPAGMGISWLRTRYRAAIWLLMVASGLVLLIACANIANLLLARATARQKEFAVRLALGAGGWRLARQLLAESLLVATLGAALGVALARWCGQFLLGLLSTANNRVYLDLALDYRVLGFTALAATLTAILAGIGPALRAARVPPNAALKENAAAVTGGRGRLRLGKALVAAQVAVSLLLLFGAGLFLRTVHNLATLDAGFHRDNVLLVGLDFRYTSVSPQQRPAVYAGILEALRRLPGVDSASQANITPISGSSWQTRLDIPGYVPQSRREATIYMNRVSDRFFATFGTPLLAGRDFGPQDTAASPKVVVVNETMARRFQGNPVGQFVQQQGRPSEGVTSYEVVGVVKDAKYRNLRDPAPPTAYVPMSQETRWQPWTNYQVRTAGPAAAVAPAVRDTILAGDKNISLTFRTFATQLSDSMVQERLVATLCAFFAGLALLLAMIGLYGVLSYTVARRRNEIGIRMALGASSRTVVRMVLRDVARMLGAGVVAGAAAALALTRLVETMLYGLRPDDPATLAWSAAALAALAMFAGYLPARRAARIHPVEALREE